MDIFYKKLLFLALFVGLIVPVNAQESVSKKVTKTFAMTNADELSLTTKYGNVNVYGWDKKTVSIEMSVKATHKKKDNAESLLKRINPTIKSNGGFIEINTEIADKEKNIFTKYFDFGDTFDFDRGNLQIDYTINVPANSEIDITNKFGNITVEDFNGNVNATIEHGDIWLNGSLKDANINLKYGKLRAQNIERGKLRLKNGHVNINSCQDIYVTSSGTNIAIDTIKSLDLDSTNDDIEIDELSLLNADLKYSTLTIKQLQTQLDAQLKISDLKILEISNPDAAITIKQESSDININIANTAFTFAATLEQGLLRIPKSFKNVKSKVLDKGKRIREVNARYGANGNGQISIKGYKGVIQLKEIN